MKIGIVTLWWSNDNYGQLLQCWALQQKLMEMGHAPFLIRFKPTYKSTLIDKICKVAMIYPFVKAIFNRYKKNKESYKIVMLDKKNKMRNFEHFREHHLLVSKELYTTLNDLQCNPPTADVYIVGSDQVWAQLLDKKDNAAYFLDFGIKSVKRISYAASFSMNQYPSKIEVKLQKQLKRFDAVSVREQEGAEICKKSGIYAQVVIDPTMLINRRFYDTLLDGWNISKPYIYVYSINIKQQDEICWSELKMVSEKLRLEIIVTPSSGYFLSEELFPDVQYIYATIPQWLSLIMGSNLVVTTSFHGVVFSILYHRPFVYFPLNGKLGRGNNRVLSLLKILDISDRIWTNGSTYEDMCFKQIDWAKVDNVLGRERQFAQQFLEEVLQN